MPRTWLSEHRRSRDLGSHEKDDSYSARGGDAVYHARSNHGRHDEDGTGDVDRPVSCDFCPDVVERSPGLTHVSRGGESAMTESAAGKERSSARSGRMRRRPPARILVGGVLVLLAFVFIIENRDPAAIRAIIPIVVMPLWAALTGMFVAGIIVGAVWRRRR
jgi:uncharacterized integral membrane protein